MNTNFQYLNETFMSKTVKENKSSSSSSSNKTRKNKTSLSSSEKAALWASFDQEHAVVRIDEKPIAIEEQCLCYKCDTPLIIMEEGFPTCSNPQCAIIYKNELDYSPEWKFFGGDDKNSVDMTRCGAAINPLLIESSFGCKIPIHQKSSYEMRKIHKWVEWQSMPHKEKALYDEFQHITIMATNAGIPRIFIDYAMFVHKYISEQKMFRGLNRHGIISASIYVSCRYNECPRTAYEIAEIFHLDKASATAGCSMAVQILHNIERNLDPSEQTELCKTTPSSFVERFASRLQVPPKLIMLSKFIADKVEKQNIIDDNTPHSIASGIIYFISENCHLQITKQQIEIISGVSGVTIGKCHKKLQLLVDKLIPLVILAEYSNKK